MSELLELYGQPFPWTHGWTEVFLHIHDDQSGHKGAPIAAFKFHGESKTETKVTSQCLNVGELEGAKRRFIAELAELRAAESATTLKMGSGRIAETGISFFSSFPGLRPQ